MFNIKVSDEIRLVCPNFCGMAVEANVVNSDYCEPLWTSIDVVSKAFCKEYTSETIKQCPAIAETRKVYRALGKDPSRYRPSGEALSRRILQGKKLYQIDTLVDLINLASLKHGYSIGGFDADKIEGQELSLGVGQDGEPYEGIGRGMLNIAAMPVYRDVRGGVGTPTSDNERTKMTHETTHLLAIVNGYDGNQQGVSECADYIKKLIEIFAQASNIELIRF